jgi:conjugal transfer pilin signal peptidase TrbI
MSIISFKMFNLKYLRLINAVLVFILVVGIGKAIKERTLLTINVSSSLDGKVFLIIKSYGHPLEFQKNDYIAFMHPWVPGPLIKKLKGLPGDQIEHKAGQAYLNHYLIGPVLNKSRDQRTLTPGYSGIIPPHHYFVAGDHARSFDSRYAEVGLLTNETIYGKAYKLF